MRTITLASSSRYRRELLAKLGLEFDSLSPDIDESALDGEQPNQLVARLAAQKAHAVAEHLHSRETASDGQAEPVHLIIASDQVACLDQQILTKPGNYENARQQLLSCNGRTVEFFTSVALLNSATKHLQLEVETTTVTFRTLAEDQISRYLQREEPYDCAGSFKVEGLGISLFQRMGGDDPNALIGLPLIRLIDFLTNEGIAIP